MAEERQPREPAHMRVDPALKAKVLEEAVAAFEARCARYFPHGAVLDVRVSDGELSVLADGEDVSGTARILVRTALATLRELGKPVTSEITPDDAVALMGIGLHLDPAAFTLQRAQT